MMLNRRRKHRMFLAVLIVCISVTLVNVQSTQAGPYAPNFQQARWVAQFGNNPLNSSDAAQRYAVGDFNGDHKSDLLYKASDSHMWIALSNGYVFSQSDWTAGWWFGASSSGTEAANRYVVADFSGDGKSDILYKGGDGTMWVATSLGDHFTQANWTNGWWFGDRPLDSSNAAQRYSIGDFNGDGKSDILFKAHNSHLWVALSQGNAFVQTEWTYGWSFGNASAGADADGRYAVADFTGDGKSDVLFKNSDGTMWVATSNGGTFSQANWTNGWFFGQNPVSTSDAAQRYMIGDFNGDGKKDLLYKAYNNEMWVALSTGSSFVQSRWATTFGSSTNGADAAGRYETGDFNADGKTDLVYKDSGAKLWVTYSTGSAFGTIVDGMPGGFFGLNPLNNSEAANRYDHGDFNNDGRTDLLYKHGDGAMWVALADSNPPDWKGVGAADRRIAPIEGDLRAAWWYDWNASASDLSNPRYVPMVRPRYAPPNLSALAAIEPRNRTWLIFNEPDTQYEDNLQPIEAAQDYATYYDQIKAGSGGAARILVGGTAYMPTTSNGHLWWTTFLSNVQRPIEGLHIHAYAGQTGWGDDSTWLTTRHCDQNNQSVGLYAATICLTSELQDAYNFFQAQPKTAGKPIWITETAPLGMGYFTGDNIRDNFMIPMVNWFLQAMTGQYPLFKRLAWFSEFDEIWDSNLLNNDNSLTLIGRQWRTY